MTHIIEQNLRNFLESENLIGKNILLSVSGGVDSMVLLEAAKNVCKSSISVIHINHNTRKACKKDEELVKNSCEKSDIPFYVRSIEKIPGKSAENFWRNERKRFTEEVQKEINADRVLTAHHATDLVETMIFRLTKGCGIEGLSPFDISTKPFWNISKDELISYAKEKNLTWNEDESNQDTKYSRNLIRKEVLPSLRSITPNLEKVFVNESIIFSKSQEFLEQTLLQKVDIEKGYLPLSKFLELEDIFKMMLLRKIAHKTPSFNELDDCLQWLLNSPEGGTKKRIGDKEIKLTKGILYW